MTSRTQAWISRSLVLALLVAAPFLLTTFRTRLVAEILIFAVFALSLNILLGFTGMPSIGHAAMFGAGGYAAGLLAVNVTSNLLFGLTAGIAGALVLAVVTGPFVIRTTGVYFIMLTLALSELFRSGVERGRTVTGGDEGVSGIPSASLMGDIQLSASGTPVLFYFYVLISFSLAYGLTVKLKRSSLGHTLVGIRENPVRMQALGYPVARYRLVAYLLAAAMGGFAGALYTQLSRFMAPDLVGFSMSALVIIMVIVGGAYTVYGPVLGAAAVIIIREVVAARFDHWEIALGMAFILIIYLMPKGLGGLSESLGHRLRHTPHIDGQNREEVDVDVKSTPTT